MPYPAVLPTLWLSIPCVLLALSVREDTYAAPTSRPSSAAASTSLPASAVAAPTSRPSSAAASRSLPASAVAAPTSRPSSAAASTSLPASAVAAPTSRPSSAATTPIFEGFRRADIPRLTNPTQAVGRTPEGVPFYLDLPPSLKARLQAGLRRPDRVIDLQEREIRLSLLRSDSGLLRAFLDWTTASPQGQIQSHHRQGVIDKDGRLIVPFRYLSLQRYSDEPALDRARKAAFLVECSNGKSGAIDLYERFTIPCIYPKTIGMPFQDRLRFVAPDQKVGVFELSTGKVILPLEYDTIYDLSQPQIFAKRQGRWGAFSPDGRIFLPFQYEALGFSSYVHCLGGWQFDLFFYKGGIAAKQKGKWGIVRKGGQIVFPFVYDAIYIPQDDGRIFYLKGKETGFLRLP